MKKQTSFTKAAQKVSLSASERAEVRARLVSYMAYHPLRTQADPSLRSHSVGYYVHRAVVAFGAYTVRLRPIIGAAAVFILVAVPVAAEQAVPGDILYPIKVRVNEGIRSQLAFSPYDKVEWETERVERRIAEARMLAKEGKLTEERENALEATVRAHTAAFKEQLNELREVDAEGAAIAEVELESALDVQSAVLDTEAAANASVLRDGTGSISELAAIVRDARADVEASSSVGTPSYDRLLTHVEENMTRVRALAENPPNDVTDALRSEIITYVNAAAEDIATAKDVHATGETGAAIAHLRTALATTQKLGVYLSNGDVRTNVPLAVLIPSEPHAGSRIAALETTSALFTEKRGLLEEALSVVGEEDAEAYVAALALLDELLASLDTQIEKQELKQAENTVAEVEGLIAELETMIANGTESHEPTTDTTPTTPQKPEIFLPGPDIE